MLQKTPARSETPSISEAEFIKLCDDIYADHQRIYQFNPSASKREALLWMLLGCLLSLLSVPAAEQSPAGGSSSLDSYDDAICEILRTRMQPSFDPQVQIAALSRKIEMEEERETY